MAIFKMEPSKKFNLNSITNGALPLVVEVGVSIAS